MIPEDREHPDVYIHANDMKSAMNGDTVLVKVTSQGPSGGRLEGEIVRIVNRAITQVVGVFQSHEVYGFVIPDDKRINRDIFIPRTNFAGAVDGQKVVAKIVSYPEGRAAAEGRLSRFWVTRMSRASIFYRSYANISCLRLSRMK